MAGARQRQEFLKALEPEEDGILDAGQGDDARRWSVVSDSASVTLAARDPDRRGGRLSPSSCGPHSPRASAQPSPPQSPLPQTPPPQRGGGGSLARDSSGGGGGSPKSLMPKWQHGLSRQIADAYDATTEGLQRLEGRLDEQRRALEEQQRASEEQRCTLEDQRRLALEEQRRASGEHQRLALEEQRLALEEQRRAWEECFASLRQDNLQQWKLCQESVSALVEQERRRFSDRGTSIERTLARQGEALDMVLRALQWRLVDNGQAGLDTSPVSGSLTSRAAGERASNSVTVGNSVTVDGTIPLEQLLDARRHLNDAGGAGASDSCDGSDDVLSRALQARGDHCHVHFAGDAVPLTGDCQDLERGPVLPVARLQGSADRTPSAAGRASKSPKAQRVVSVSTVSTRNRQHRELEKTATALTLTPGAIEDGRTRPVHLGTRAWPTREFESNCFWFLAALQSSQPFVVLCIIMNAVNALLVCAHTSMLVRQQLEKALHDKVLTKNEPEEYNATLFYWMEWVYIVWMCLEVLLNLAVQRCHFFRGSECLWNAFDVLILISASVQQVLKTVLVNSTFFRVLKIFHLMKCFHAAWIVRMFHDVRRMLVSMKGSFLTLLWAFMLMVLIMVLFGTVILQGVLLFVTNGEGYVVAGGRRAEEAIFAEGTTRGAAPRKLSPFGSLDDLEHLQELKLLYGDMYHTVVTLFCAITGGADWSDLAAPLVKINHIYMVLWIVYVAFMLFGVLNILIGSFVDKAIQAAAQDRDTAIQSQMQDQKEYVGQLRKVYMASDHDHCGQINFQEFKLFVQDESVVAYLDTLGINVRDARQLFDLLDADGSGTVTIDEFVDSCLRLKGQASAMDMAKLSTDSKKVRQRLASHIHNAEKEFMQVQAQLQRLENLLLVAATSSGGSLAPSPHRARASSGSPVAAARATPQAHGVAPEVEDDEPPLLLRERAALRRPAGMDVRDQKKR